ncbi:MAG: glutaredoxin domain-containing protein [Pseudomonadota bacterium]|nr:glutaredoxin domain-containing protein [Pseudomonadota bacterium]
MQIIIYGKDNCVDCDKTRMLCQIQSIKFEYHALGQDISLEELQAKVGQPVRSLPQIFVRRDGAATHVGGYDALRHMLQASVRQAAARQVAA